jgi:hypothetical protein
MWEKKSSKMKGIFQRYKPMPWISSQLPIREPPIVESVLAGVLWWQIIKRYPEDFGNLGAERSSPKSSGHKIKPSTFDGKFRYDLSLVQASHHTVRVNPYSYRV